MNAAYHLSTSWTHWLFAGLVVVATVVGLVGIFLSVKPEPRPYDYERDGECDNRSRIRVLSTTAFGPPGADAAVTVAGQGMRLKVVGPEELEFVDYDERFPALP